MQKMNRLRKSAAIEDGLTYMQWLYQERKKKQRDRINGLKNVACFSNLVKKHKCTNSSSLEHKHSKCKENNIYTHTVKCMLHLRVLKAAIEKQHIKQHTEEQNLLEISQGNSSISTM